MEEDIKILEGMLGFISVLDTKQRQALENLIKGYREERHLRIHYENRLDNMEQLYVDKDKIKEILGRLNISDIEPWSIYIVNGEILFDLEKLLGG